MLTDEHGYTVAIPIDTIRNVTIRSFTEDGEYGIPAGVLTWHLDVTDADGDSYVSPSVPTRDDAIMLLRHILETDETLVDPAHLVGEWFGPAWEQV